MTQETPKVIALFKEKETEEKPKYARMPVDQLSVDVSALLISDVLLEHYKPQLKVWPGLKYIKKHINFLPYNGLRI